MTGRKAHWAAVACALWLLGFDVVPLAHMVFHEALEQHEHGHHIDRAHHHHEGDEQPSPAEHGQGSVAHHDLAANVPLPAVPEVLEALFAWDVARLVPHDERPADRQPRTIRARAPPRSAAT